MRSDEATGGNLFTNLFRTKAVLTSTLLLSLIATGRASAQNGPSLQKAYLDSSNNVVIVYSDGGRAEPPKDKGQAGCESLKVAEDGKTVGWLVDFENDGTSYPVALSLVIFRDKRILQQFGGTDVIEDWQFRAGGTQLAFVTNALHGGGRAHYELRDLAKGTLIAKWDGPAGPKSPAWMRGLWDQDAE